MGTAQLERGTPPSPSWGLVICSCSPRKSWIIVLDVNPPIGDSSQLLYILCGAHCTTLSAGLSLTELHRTTNDLQSRLLWWTPLVLVYVRQLVTALLWTLKNTAVRISWAHMACCDACRSADSPPAIPAGVELEVQHRALDSDYVRLFYSCLFHPVAPLWHPGKERPGPYQSPKCKSLVLPGELAAHQLASSVVDTVLKRAELWETKRLKDIICIILCSDSYSISESKSPRRVGTGEYFRRLAKTACRQCAISRRSKV